MRFDVIVLGAGPGGYVAAIRAAQLGLKVAVVEKQHLGGVCLNWGCIPTKSLLRCADIYKMIKHADAFGIKCKEVTVDFKHIIDRSRRVAEKLSAGIEHLLKANKVAIIRGNGVIKDTNYIEVTDVDDQKKSYQTKNIIIATGARPRLLPNFTPDNKCIWTYKEALLPSKQPKKLLVIGSGAIGMEFASFYHEFGSEVTVVEIADRILSSEDSEIAAFVHKSFEKRGIKIMTSVNVTREKKSTNQVDVIVAEGNKKHRLNFDTIISAAGIVANIENIGLENAKVKTDKTRIAVDKFMQTSVKNIYAIGDVTSAPWLAHKASHEGIICVEKIAGLKPHGIDINNIPACTYCEPQIASLGLQEEQAKQQGYKVKIGRFPFAANGKAVAMGEEEGLIKVIFDDKTGELLGAHMVGSEVTEMINGYTIAKTMECTETELINSIFPHPTMSEMMHEAVLNAYERALHIV